MSRAPSQCDPEVVEINANVNLLLGRCGVSTRSCSPHSVGSWMAALSWSHKITSNELADAGAVRGVSSNGNTTAAGQHHVGAALPGRGQCVLHAAPARQHQLPGRIQRVLLQPAHQPPAGHPLVRPPVRGWCRMGAPFSSPVPNHRICSVTMECALVRPMHFVVVAVPGLVATKCACRACAGSTPT